MSNHVKPTEWPWMAWFNGWDHHPIRCVVQETEGTYAIVVTENGREIERETSTSWEEANDVIETLRKRHFYKPVPPVPRP